MQAHTGTVNGLQAKNAAPPIHVKGGQPWKRSDMKKMRADSTITEITVVCF